MSEKMSHEERVLLIQRFAHNWAEPLEKVMDDVTHEHVLKFIEDRGELLQFKTAGEPIYRKEGTPEPEHWTFAMKDDFVYPDEKGKPTDKVVPMTISYFGPKQHRANAQNVIETVVRLARGAGMTPFRLSVEILKFVEAPEAPATKVEKPAALAGVQTKKS